MDALEPLARSTFFMLSLLLLGYISKRLGIIGDDGERTLNSFVFYFSLPALVIWGLSSTVFTEGLIRVALGSLLPILMTAILIWIACRIAKLSGERTVLLLAASISGNTGFLGIPYVRALNPEDPALGGMAIVSWAATLVAMIFLVIPLMERVARGRWGVTLGNPLIWAALIGLGVSLSGLSLPGFVSYTLRELGSASGPVAIFALGASLGRMGATVKLDLPPLLGKVLLLPAITYALGRLMGLAQVELLVCTLMSAMPVAVALAVFSEIYDFYREEITSLVFLTSVMSVGYLGALLLMIPAL